MGAKIWLALKVAVVPVVVALVAATPQIINALRTNQAAPAQSSASAASAPSGSKSSAPAGGTHLQIGGSTGHINVNNGSQTFNNNSQTFNNSNFTSNLIEVPVRQVTPGVAVPQQGIPEFPSGATRPQVESSNRDRATTQIPLGQERSPAEQFGRNTDLPGLKRWLLEAASRSPTFALAFDEPIVTTRRSISWSPSPGQNGDSVTVPIGFTTDFANIPPVFWTLLPADEIYIYPAMVHSYLYWHQSVSRDKADFVFKRAMEDMKISPPVVEIVFAAARLSGAKSWQDNLESRANGHKRILILLPDTRLAWDDWKSRTGVFSK